MTKRYSGNVNTCTASASQSAKAAFTCAAHIGKIMDAIILASIFVFIMGLVLLRAALLPALIMALVILLALLVRGRHFHLRAAEPETAC